MSIHFPSGSALTDVDSISVTGVAFDADGILSVSVNGVLAQTQDGFAHWRAVVPLELGSNTLVVESTDLLGNSSPAAASTVVERRASGFESMDSVAYDSLRDRCLMVQGFYPPEVVAVDLASAQDSVVSSVEVGGGAPMGYPTAIAYDAQHDRAIVTTFSPNQVLGIDLATGQRTLLSGPGVGQGPGILNGRAVALLPGGDEALVTSNISARVYLVDLTNGDRSIVSASDVGSGPSATAVGGVEYHPSSGRAILVDFSADRLLWLDLATGQRSVLSSSVVGTGPAFDNPWQICLAPGGMAAWVVPLNEPAVLYEVDLAQGNRTAVTPSTTHGAYMGALRDVAADATSAFLVEHVHRALLRADTTNGTLTPILDISVGSGDVLRAPALAVPDPAGSQRMVFQSHADPVLRSVDVTSGARSVVSGAGVGTGPPLGTVRDMALEVVGPDGSLLVLSDDELVRVDRATGDRRVLSSKLNGSGTWLNQPQFLATSAGSAEVFVFDFIPGVGAGLLRIDPASGEREVVASPSVGSGPALGGEDFAVNAAGTRGWFTQILPGRILEVDLTTGDRHELSGPTAGAGPMFEWPQMLLVDDAGGRLIVAEFHKLHSVDLASGDRTQLVRNSSGSGAGIWFMRCGALLPGLLVIGDSDLRRITAIDMSPLSGQGTSPRQRVVVSD